MARSYKKLAHDVKAGSQILCADGSIVLEVVETDPAAGIVTCRCQNNAKLGCVTLLAVPPRAASILSSGQTTPYREQSPRPRLSWKHAERKMTACTKGCTPALPNCCAIGPGSK